MWTSEESDDDLEEEFEELMLGALQSSVEEENKSNKAVDKLHDAVEAVTGKRPPKKKSKKLPTIGFIQQQDKDHVEETSKDD